MSVRMPTEAQERALVGVARAIRDATDEGERVPCVENPQAWDQPLNSPSMCDACPMAVFAACDAYADTGAVTHGIIARRRLSTKHPRSTVARPPVTTEPRAA